MKPSAMFSLFARRLGLAVTALLLVTPAWAQLATYDTATQVLSVPMLKKDGLLYTDATFSLPAHTGWALSNPGTKASSLSTKVPAEYNTTAATLTLPYLKIDNAYFFDMKLSLPVDQPWSVLSYGNFNQFENITSTLSFPINTTVNNKWGSDTAGKQVFKLDNGQTWEIVDDDPCFPRKTVPDASGEFTGISDVSIYPDPKSKDYLWIASYGGSAESCIVAPVTLPGIMVAAAGSELSANVASLSGVPGKTYDLHLTGGTQPYFLFVDKPEVASIRMISQSLDRGGQTARVFFNRTGSATLSVYDFNRNKIDVSLIGQSDLMVQPSEITVTAGTIPLTVYVSGGMPPYKVLNASEQKWVSVSQPVLSNVPGMYAMSVSFVADTGGVKLPIFIIDSMGSMTALSITVNASTSSSGGTGSGSGTSTGGSSGTTKPVLK